LENKLQLSQCATSALDRGESSGPRSDNIDPRKEPAISIGQQSWRHVRKAEEYLRPLLTSGR